MGDYQKCKTCKAFLVGEGTNLYCPVCYPRMSVETIMVDDMIFTASLPTVEEIEEIMTDHYWDSLEGERGILERHCKFLAKAIHKRLTKE